MKRGSESFLFLCERELPPTILVLVLAKVAKVGGADRGVSLVASVRSSLALWVTVGLADAGVLISPSSVSSSSSDDGSGSVDSIK